MVALLRHFKLREEVVGALPLRRLCHQIEVERAPVFIVPLFPAGGQWREPLRRLRVEIGVKGAPLAGKHHFPTIRELVS